MLECIPFLEIKILTIVAQILALATTNFENIAKAIIDRFAKEGIECEWKLLEPAEDGATVSRGGFSSVWNSIVHYVNSAIRSRI